MDKPEAQRLAFEIETKELELKHLRLEQEQTAKVIKNWIAMSPGQMVQKPQLESNTHASHSSVDAPQEKEV